MAATAAVNVDVVMSLVLCVDGRVGADCSDDGDDRLTGLSGSVFIFDDHLMRGVRQVSVDAVA
jgi:hypothetical protein